MESGPPAQQHSSQDDKEGLQGKGQDGQGYADKGAGRGQGGEKGAESKLPDAEPGLCRDG